MNNGSRKDNSDPANGIFTFEKSNMTRVGALERSSACDRWNHSLEENEQPFHGVSGWAPREPHLSLRILLHLLLSNQTREHHNSYYLNE